MEAHGNLNTCLLAMQPQLMHGVRVLDVSEQVDAPPFILCDRRYENPEQKETGRAWVRYDNGNEAPLEPRLGAGLMSALG